MIEYSIANQLTKLSRVLLPLKIWLYATLGRSGNSPEFLSDGDSGESHYPKIKVSRNTPPMKSIDFVTGVVSDSLRLAIKKARNTAHFVMAFGAAT